MRKLKLIFAVLLLTSSTIFAQEIYLPFVPDDDLEPNKEVSRSINISPTAFIDGQYITINYPMSTTSQVIIRDAETDAVVYSAPYDATRQVLINLSILPEGTYEIRLYAFGKWWWGEFEIIDNM